MKPYGIGVATGEMCQNRVMFKQFLKAGGMQFCQIDSCRLGGVNENIAVMLMAEKLNSKFILWGLCRYNNYYSGTLQSLVKLGKVIITL